jgi:exonuclease III
MEYGTQTMSQQVRKLRHRNTAKNYRKPAYSQAPPTREDKLLATGMLDVLLHKNKIRAARPSWTDAPGPKHIKKSTAKAADAVNMASYNVNTLGKDDSVILEILLTADEEDIDVIALQGTRKLSAGGPGVVSGPFKMGTGREYWVFRVSCLMPTGSKNGVDGFLLAFSADRWNKQDFVSQSVTVPGRAMSVRVRWSKYDITVHNCYAPTAESPPATKDKFWQALYRAKGRTLHRTTNILFADANGHIGKGYNPPGIGTQGAEKHNVNGHFFADLVVACELAVINTYCSEKGAAATTHQGHRIDYACLPRKLLGYIDHSKSGVSKTSQIGISRKDHFPVFLCWKKLPPVQDTLDKKKKKKTHGWANIDTNKLTTQLREHEDSRTRANPKPLHSNRIQEMQNLFHEFRTNDLMVDTPTGTTGWWKELYEHAGEAAAHYYEKPKEEIQHPWIDDDLLHLI